MTKVYELTYDYGDGYFTVFMTSDKKYALDFIESVRAHDQAFTRDTGSDDYDESLIDNHNDNHPLKPHAKQIFEGMYEDSFSEWALEYVGETHADAMQVLEHNLYTK